MELTLRMLAMSGVLPGARLMDVGCGEGATVEYLLRSGYDASGVDIAINPGIPGNLPLEYGTAYELPCGDSELDGIFCECVLSLLDFPGAALREFKRALKPGGFVMASDLYSRAEGGRIGGMSWNIRTGADICQMMSRSGFTIKYFEDHSEKLKTMYAQLVMDMGRSAFCEKFAVNYESVRRLKLSYFSIVAQLEKQ
jgi:ubiquinone/menaquinone biosynthesis C-methylase UbiE